MAASSSGKTPRRLLLATDLSARCDRALDRAANLAADWNAALTVVHAFEPDAYTITRDPRPEPSWRKNPDLKRTIAAEQIRQDIGKLDVAFDVVIKQGAPADVILETVGECGAGLIVTGIARGETFGRFIFGNTVDRLVRSETVPILVVKARPRHAYHDIVVATDFSAASRGAIDATVAMFPKARITLLHCYDSPSSALMDPAVAVEAGKQLAMGEYAEFLKAQPDRMLADLPILIEHGSVDRILQAYAADKNLDLIVTGSSGKSAIPRALLGSTAELIMASAPSDVLVVGPRH